MLRAKIALLLSNFASNKIIQWVTYAGIIKKSNLTMRHILSSHLTMQQCNRYFQVVSESRRNLCPCSVPYCLKRIHVQKTDQSYWKVLLRSNYYHTSIPEARQCQERKNPTQNTYTVEFTFIANLLGCTLNTTTYIYS